MAFYLVDYEAKYGKLIIEDFTRYKFNIIWFSLPTIVFVTVSIGSVFTFIDFSHHATLSQVPQWWVKGMGLFYFVLGGYAIWKLRRLFTPHGACLFEKGILSVGHWGFDDEDTFISFEKIERIVIAPSRTTSTKIHKAIMTVGFGQPLDEGYDDWTYCATELENDVRSSFGKALFVEKPSFFDYDTFTIDLAGIKNPGFFRSKLKELAEKNDVPFSDESHISWANEELKPIVFRNARDCERDFGRVIYEGFSGRRSYVFERGILEWASWPWEPSGIFFYFFDNIGTILIQPSKKTALRYLEPMERIYYEFAPPDRKERCKIDPLELEGRALKWENYMVMLLKSKRADTYCVEMKELKDPRIFIALLKDLAKRHGIELIDESHLPSGTGEKISIP